MPNPAVLMDYKPVIVPGYHDKPNNDELINSKINELDAETQKASEFIKRLESGQEAYSLQCYEFQSIDGKEKSDDF